VNYTSRSGGSRTCAGTSARWRGSWEFIDGRCAGLWPTRCLRIGRSRNGSAPGWPRRYRLSTRFWRLIVTLAQAGHTAIASDAAAAGEAGDRCRRVHSARVCKSAQAGAGVAVSRVFVPQSYQFGGERRWTGTRSRQYLMVSRARSTSLHALDGLGRGLSSSLSTCHTTGFSGSARVGVRLVWRSVSHVAFDNLSSA